MVRAVRQIVASIDNRLPLFDVRTQTQQIDDLLYQERLFAKPVGFFATLALVGIGVVLGIGASLATAKIAHHEVAGLLYGLKIDDITSIVFAGAAIAVVTALAGLIPARRAMRGDPMVALRH